MLLIMLANLYIVRIVLDVLGVSDYGIYEVVGGLVVIFTFLADTMTTSTQRFFSFELGKKNFKNLNSLFNISLLIYFLFGLSILVVGQVVGKWFIINKLTIPLERIDAAEIVLSFTLLTFFFNILRTPFNSLIIAHEKMNIYAYISLIEVLLKLTLVFLLKIFTGDKLIAYSTLLCINMLIILLLYSFYCVKKFPECKIKFVWDSHLSKELIYYSSWNILGSTSNALRNHGTSILLNIFFNPVINAARGIAFQINSALLSFANNFFIAVKPQITKLWANNEKATMEILVFSSAKISYLLILVLSIPLLFETEFILSLWLKQIPNYSILFTKLFIINTLIDILHIPIASILQATGKIKKYQIIVSILFMMNLPFSYFLLNRGLLPEVTLIVSIVISITSIYPSLIICQQISNISIKEYATKVFFPIIAITILLLLITSLLYILLPSTLMRFIILFTTCICAGSYLGYYIAFTKAEREIIINFLNSFKNKLNPK